MERVLITGSAGYIGSVVTAYLLEHDIEVVGIDDCRTGFLQPMRLLEEKFSSRFKFYKHTINHDKLRMVFTSGNKIDVVVHFAASSKVDESVRNPRLYQQNNVEVSKILLEEMKSAKVKKLIFASSAAVYGEAQYVPIDENHPLIPTNPYGTTKLAVEKLIHKANEWGLKSIIFRFFNVCGASDDGRMGDSRKPSSALVQNVVRGAIKLETFRVTCSPVDTPDGTTIRDYLDVRDIALACYLAIKRLDRDKENKIINLGSGQGESIKEVVDLVDKILGTKTKIKTTNLARMGEVSKVIADVKKARELLDWIPKRKLPDSVKSLINWYQLHPNGWIE